MFSPEPSPASPRKNAGVDLAILHDYCAGNSASNDDRMHIEIFCRFPELLERHFSKTIIGGLVGCAQGVHHANKLPEIMCAVIDVAAPASACTKAPAGMIGTSTSM